MHAVQGRTVDIAIAAMEANHLHLTTQKSIHVEISRDRAELVTDDRAALRERLEAEDPERVKGPEAGVDAGRTVEREGGASQSGEWNRASESAMEPSRAPNGVKRDLGL